MTFGLSSMPSVMPCCHWANISWQYSWISYGLPSVRWVNAATTSPDVWLWRPTLRSGSSMQFWMSSHSTKRRTSISLNCRRIGECTSVICSISPEVPASTSTSPWTREVRNRRIDSTRASSAITWASSTSSTIGWPSSPTKCARSARNAASGTRPPGPVSATASGNSSGATASAPAAPAITRRTAAVPTGAVPAASAASAASAATTATISS